MHHGVFNPNDSVERIGIEGLGSLRWNMTEPELVQTAIERGEGEIGKGGVLLVTTGKHTGRSPKDKFMVREASTEADVWWDGSGSMEPDAFDRLRADMFDHMRGREFFAQDLYAGADPAHRLNVRVVTELCWHSLFIRHLLRRPSAEELPTYSPEFHVVNCPSFKADPDRHGCRSETVIAISIEQKLILIARNVLWR